MVETFQIPDYDTQPAGQYFPTLGSAISVMSRLAAAFAPHENSPADMTVVVDAGALFNNYVLTEIAPQVSAPITAPSIDPRIDRVVADSMTGTISVITGTESATPVAPAIPHGAMPIASVLLQSTTTIIDNSMISDERVVVSPSVSAGRLLNVQTFISSGTYTATSGTSFVIVEAVGAGGGGGGCAATGAGQVSVGGGGGAGSYGRAMITSGFNGVTITVGASVPASSPGTAGAAGGGSSFGTLLVSPGGKGGSLGSAVSPPTLTGGSNVSDPPTGANIVSGKGQSGYLGMALSTSVLHGGRGAPSVFSMSSSGTLGPGNGGGTGLDYAGPGGGGAANGPSSAARPGGTGANGLVVVYEYA